MNPVSVICPDMDIRQDNYWIAHDFHAIEQLKGEIDSEDDFFEEKIEYKDCFCDDSEPGICFFCGREY